MVQADSSSDAENSRPVSITRFDIVAQSDPQTLMRLLGYFAQLGLVPRRVDAVIHGSVKVRIEQLELGEQQARVIAEKMRSSVLVETVRVRRGSTGSAESRRSIGRTAERRALLVG